MIKIFTFYNKYYCIYIICAPAAKENVYLKHKMFTICCFNLFSFFYGYLTYTYKYIIYSHGLFYIQTYTRVDPRHEIKEKVL